MARRHEDSLLEILTKAPWWVSGILAIISYLGLKFILPSMLIHSPNIVNKAIANVASVFAPIISVIFVFTGVLSLLLRYIERKKLEKNNLRKKELLNSQRSLPDLNALSWREFEEVIGETFKNQGYDIKELGGNSPDGGIDLILQKNGVKIIVQCKHWESYPVGVKVVRELYGVVVAEGAIGGMLITTGNFTRDAEIWAHGKSLQLIRGNELSRLIQKGQIGNFIP